MPYRVGVDVGGTFTDLVATDEAGSITTLKVASTPLEPHKAVLSALRAFQERRPGAEIAALAHSTTIATNALLGQLNLELPRVALITTAGFRDVIEIGRQNRSELYNLFVQRPKPLVKRADRLCVRERIDHRGNVLVPLNEDDVRAAIAHIKNAGITAIAIGLLNSYANDAHEQRIAQMLAKTLPKATVTQSAQLDPEYREFERFSTAVVNAALRPIMGRYLDALRKGAAKLAISAPLYVMQSQGGMSRAEDVARAPAAAIESGPGSGVIAAAALAAQRGIARVLSFDMGGTTAKAGTIVDGHVQVAHEFEAAGRAHGGRPAKGSGYPVRFPFVDLAEASAGGGTIAWLDAADALRVGPQSAGADPGPACYGKSDRATVTDANVVLGRLDSSALLGGTFTIQPARSHAAIARIGQRIGLSPEQTAAGIITLIDSEMAKILRIVTIERGLDPRDFTLMAFGGNGPLHACALADELGIRRVIVPAAPGLFSAFGLVVAPLQATRLRPLMRDAETFSDAEFERLLAELRLQAETDLRAQRSAKENAFGSDAHATTLDMRYRGQSFELSILAEPTVGQTVAAFHAQHAATYGYSVPDEPVELVNARVTAKTQTQPRRHRFEVHAAPNTSSRRRVWLDDAWHEVRVFARSALREGNRFAGPAIIEEFDATTFVPAAWTAMVQQAELMLETAR
jgi:N-methylhydantoinase A